MTYVDPDVEWLVLWVPGTWGDGVHPGFLDAVDRVLGKRAQTLCVEYPASANFEFSVPEGASALNRMIRSVAAQLQPFQRIVVAGSSQGAWVIHAARATLGWQGYVHRSVTYGLPGASEYQPVRNDDHWDVVSPFDAVTWHWHGPERRIVRHASAVAAGRWWRLLPLLPYMVINPVVTAGLLGLLLTHHRAPRLSPHDYTPTMSVTVAWLTN